MSQDAHTPELFDCPFCGDLIAALEAAKAFHDRDSGLNGFTAEYELLRAQIDAALSKARQEDAP